MRKSKQSRNGPSEDDRSAARARMHEEAVDDDEREEELESSGASATARHGTTFLKPMQGKKVWIVLAGIMVVIGVVVLYVYQAGDRKTILGNQPIPVGRLEQQNVPVGAGEGSMAIGPGAQDAPVGGGLQIVQHVPPPARGGAARNTVQCPQCSMQGLPVCSPCGVVMQPLGDGSGLFACPSCGLVGIPICPRDGVHMTLASTGNPTLAAAPWPGG